MRRSTMPAVATAAVFIAATAGCSSGTTASTSPTHTSAAAVSTSQAHSSAPAASTSASTSASPTPPPNVNVTKSQADQILTAFQGANNRANADRDDHLMATIETDPALKVDLAGLKGSRYSDPKNTGKAQYWPMIFTNRSYAIPKLTAYPRWFVATGTYKFDPKTKPAEPTLTQDLVFVQTDARAAWKVAYAPPVGSKTPPPLVTADGTATAVTAADAHSLAAAPAQLTGWLVAAELGGSGSTAAARFSNTTQYTDQELSQTKSSMSPATVSITTDPQAGTYPVYAVRTADGGALVFTTKCVRWKLTETKAFLEQYSDIDLSGEFAAAYGSSKAYHSLNEDHLEQDLVYVPAAGKGKPKVFGTQDGLTAVTNQ